jgi:hypothetical protein
VSAAALLDRLDRVRRTGDGRWLARCPAHDDRGPSLSVRETADGRVLLHCFAGCEVADVLAALGYTWADLYPPRPTDLNARRHFRRERVALASDALRCLAFEATIVALAASDLAQGRALSEADRQRVTVAAGRIAAAKELCDA